jgi:hypothetical protein
MKLVIYILVLGFTSFGFANNETTQGQGTVLEQLNSYIPDGSPRQITAEVLKLRDYMKAHPDHALPYAYINKRSTNGAFTTYLIEMKSGKVIKTFPSLIGYNGIGCHKGQSRPGIFKLTDSVGRAAHPKSWWGNGKKYYDIANVPGGSPCGENLSNQVVAHSNVNVPNSCSAGTIRSRSAGCFTVSPANWDDLANYADKAYIYNVL